jgi:NADH dehydrogenase
MKSVEQHAFPMKTMTEAIAIRNQIIRCLERAEQEPDEARRRELLTFVCVGGGPTGVEEAGAISELIYQSMRRDYHKLNFDEVDIKLMEGTDRVLAMMPEKLRKRTVSILQQKKVDVRLSTAVVDYDGHTIKLKSGESIPTQTVIWAAGVKASPIMAKLGTEAIRDGRINVQKNLSVKGLVNVYAIGDCACFIQQEGERPLATVAPVAMKEAELCATNIIRRMQGASQEVFSYKDRGAMATIGRGAAVLHSGSINMTGFFAWSAWLWVHLFKLAGTYANLTVSLKWMWNYLHNTRLSRILINR